MRTILKCEYLTPRLEMLNTLDLLSISQKIKLKTIIMIRKMLENELPEYLNENIINNINTHNVNTRHRNNFRLPIVRNEQAKRNIFYNGLKLYNELPNDIKNENNISQFKFKCRNHVKSTCPVI